MGTVAGVTGGGPRLGPGTFPRPKSGSCDGKLVLHDCSVVIKLPGRTHVTTALTQRYVCQSTPANVLWTACPTHSLTGKDRLQHSRLSQPLLPDSGPAYVVDIAGIVGVDCETSWTLIGLTVTALTLKQT